MKVGIVLAKRMLALTLLVSLFVGLIPTSAGAITQEEVRDKLYEKVNDSRRNKGLRPLRRNNTLQKWAQDHAGAMARKEKLYHDLSLAAEVNKLTRIVWWYGENVQYLTNRPAIAQKIHRKFMESPGHRANILTKRATHMGFGVVKRDGTFWVVQRFTDLRN